MDPSSSSFSSSSSSNSISFFTGRSWIHNLLPLLLIILLIFHHNNTILTTHSYSLHPLITNSTFEHYYNHTAISSFRVLNRRALIQCPDPNTYLKINATATRSGVPNANLSDEDFITVTVGGVFVPQSGDWVGMISPSDSDVGTCLLNKAKYVQTGDLSSLPLLCHYPVKAQYVSSDPGYLSCKNKECQKYNGSDCVVSTCSGTLSFHVVNIRTDIEFVFFAGGFDTPCILAKSNTLSFANPNKPLYAHLSSTDSTATSMRVTWVSGDKEAQQLQYGDGKTETSKASTFTQNDMCSSALLPSPAKDFGWHDPGYIHSAVMSGLTPSSTFSYKYGRYASSPFLADNHRDHIVFISFKFSDSVGWSNEIKFKTPPAGGSDELKFIAFGDMGKAPVDAASVEHYIQPGSLSVIKAITDEVADGNVDSIFHIGDISYATGFLVEWDFFLQLISPMASQVPYMTAIGNHERDYVDSGSVYMTPDSGGECGIPYETYFPMPTPAADKPWYSIEQGSVHFTVISTEHDWTENSEQYQWMQKDMASVDRSRTPWLIFTGHRPMYTSSNGLFDVDKKFVGAVEPLLVQNKVDVALFGHVHNYERTCSIYEGKCLAMPTKDENGIDTYNFSNYSAPVQAVIGMAGFSLDAFSNNPASWSLVRISAFGYLRGHATKNDLTFELVNSKTKQVDDSFRLTRT